MSCPSLVLSSVRCFPATLTVSCHLVWHFGWSVCLLVSLEILWSGCRLDFGCAGDLSVIITRSLARLDALLDHNMSRRRDNAFMNLSRLALLLDLVAVLFDSLFTMGVSLRRQSSSDLRSGLLPVNAFVQWQVMAWSFLMMYVLAFLQPIMICLSPIDVISG